MKINLNKSSHNKRQLIIIVAIVLASVILGIMILISGNKSSLELSVGQKENDHAKTDRDTKHQSNHNQGEGKVILTHAQIEAAAIVTDTVSATHIKSVLHLPGEIRLNEDRTSHVVPRITGVVESVSVSLGQAVKKGQILATLTSPVVAEQRSELQTAKKRLSLVTVIYEREKKLWEQKISAEQDYLQVQQAKQEAEIAVTNAEQKLRALGLATSNLNMLNRFELRAPFDGVVIEKHLTLGEAVKEDTAVFTVSDLNSVWAEINVPMKDLPLVRIGEKVTIKATSFEATATGTVAFVGALIGEQTRLAKARVVLSNPNVTWRPGLFVNIEVTAAEIDIPISVTVDAIQTIDDKTVIFLKVTDGFIAQPVRLGRSDSKRVEVLEGVKAGVVYVASGSFIMKSELGKHAADPGH